MRVLVACEENPTPMKIVGLPPYTQALEKRLTKFN